MASDTTPRNTAADPSTIAPSSGRSQLTPDSRAIVVLAGRALQVNRGTSLNLEWVESVRVNTSAVERRAATLVTRRTVKKDWQLAWLLRAITCMDLTTLSGDDTDERVRRLCAKARQPLQNELLEKLKIADLQIRVGAVCVYLYDEILAFKDACGPAHLKVILGTGDLLTLRNVAKASMVAMMAGADFIKTSTGKETVNATLPVGLVMTRAIREYAEETGMAVGFKPAGGIRTAKQSLEWLALMKEELGDAWLAPHLFRLGASSGMLADIERQLEFHVTGRYSAEHRHPIA